MIHLTQTSTKKKNTLIISVIIVVLVVSSIGALIFYHQLTPTLSADAITVSGKASSGALSQPFPTKHTNNRICRHSNRHCNYFSLFFCSTKQQSHRKLLSFPKKRAYLQRIHKLLSRDPTKNGTGNRLLYNLYRSCTRWRKSNFQRLRLA